MKSKKIGFTLIEVVLFLAVTGALFVGIAMTLQTSVWRQRFFDATENFAEFLRTVYSEVSNPQSVGNGRDDIVIYGKLIVFGETTGLDGGMVNCTSTAISGCTAAGSDIATPQRIYVYDVVGQDGNIGSSTTDALLNVKANVATWKKQADGEYIDFRPAGLVEDYQMRWQAAVEFADTSASPDRRWRGSILIVRHPSSGTINTLVAKDVVIPVNQVLTNIVPPVTAVPEDIENLLISQLGNFRTEEVSFCVNRDNDQPTSPRHEIRLAANGRNGSAVEIIGLDDEDSNCK